VKRDDKKLQGGISNLVLAVGKIPRFQAASNNSIYSMESSPTQHTQIQMWTRNLCHIVTTESFAMSITYTQTLCKLYVESKLG